MFHKHLLVYAEIRKPLTDPEVTKGWLRSLVNSIGMNITKHGGPHCDYVEKEGNCGIAGIVMIETSHCSIHVWDKAEPPFLQLDVYSCKDFNTHDVLRFIYEMEPTKLNYKVINRNWMLNEASRIY